MTHQFFLSMGHISHQEEHLAPLPWSAGWLVIRGAHSRKEALSYHQLLLLCSWSAHSHSPSQDPATWRGLRRPACQRRLLAILTTVWLTIFQVCSGAEVICVQWKPYFRFGILIFSQAGDMQYDTPLWCWVVATSHRSQAGMWSPG